MMNAGKERDKGGRRGGKEKKTHLVSGVSKLAAATYHALKAVMSCERQNSQSQDLKTEEEGRRTPKAPPAVLMAAWWVTPSSAIPRSMKVTAKILSARFLGGKEKDNALVRKKKTPERAMEERREAMSMMKVKMNHPQTVRDEAGE
jgi:hypothetical protein